MLKISYQLNPQIKCLIGKDNAVLLPKKQRLPNLSTMQLAVLKKLSTEALVTDSETPAEIRDLISQLTNAGVLTTTVYVGDDKLYTLHPFRNSPEQLRPTPIPETNYSLSKFAILRRINDAVIIENPLSWCDVEIAHPQALAALMGLPNSLNNEAIEQFWRHLYWGAHTSTSEEDKDFFTQCWSPHELWFHRNSTFGNRNTSWTQFGPTRWAEGKFPALPARKPLLSTSPHIPLPPPDLEALRETDISLTAAIENRKSTRSFNSSSPISLSQVSELLYRCQRTRSIATYPKNNNEFDELPSRPYPSGGSLYELEIYPIIRAASGIEAGMYHYNSHAHALHFVAPIDHPAVERLTAPAALTLTDGQLPQVVLIISARAGRMMWAYEKMSYSVILKHVGILTQTLYLVATAMGLGGVAQGYSDTQAFTEATQLPELDECAVGSFVVGSPQK